MFSAGGAAFIAARRSPRQPPRQKSPDAVTAEAPGESDPWARLPRILDGIVPPSFAARDFNISEFGASGDGIRDNTESIGQAIAACHAAGGGRVVVPSGVFLTGAIHLKSNVNLHVASGATLRFSTDTKAYPLVFTRFEGTELMNYSPLIYAWRQRNIAVTGAGTLDGAADAEHWWDWKDRTRPGHRKNDRERLTAMAEEGVPPRKRIFGPGHFLRPSFIQPYHCRNVLIEGVTLLRSPMWQIHPVLSSNVTVREVKLNASGPNTDGCDPESCSDVLIEGCSFDTGDDCIAIKSGRNADGRRVHAASRTIAIRNCEMKRGHGGVSIGSEDTGGVYGVYVENCRMGGPHLGSALRIKDNAMRGGVVAGVYARDIRVGTVAGPAVSIDFHYEEGAAGGFRPVVRDVKIERLTTEAARYALFLRGFKSAPIADVVLRDCSFGGVQRPNVLENVVGLVAHNVVINGKEFRPAVVDRRTARQAGRIPRLS
jgi:polygalacturonase